MHVHVFVVVCVCHPLVVVVAASRMELVSGDAHPPYNARADEGSMFLESVAWYVERKRESLGDHFP